MRAASSGEAPKHYPQDSDAVGGDLCVDDPGRGSHDWLAAPGVEPGEQLVHAWSTGPSHMVFPGRRSLSSDPSTIRPAHSYPPSYRRICMVRLYEDR